MGRRPSRRFVWLAPLLACVLATAGCTGSDNLVDLARRVDIQPGHVKIRPADEPSPSPSPTPSPIVVSPTKFLPTATPSVTEPAVTSTVTPSPRSSVASPTPSGTPGASLPADTGMVHIAAGRYDVGSVTPDDHHVAVHSLELPAFWIDQNLASNVQYKAFVDRSGHAEPAAWRDGNYPANRDKYPIEGLTWNDAQAYCAWQNKRLPSEAEWEAAGRGPGPNPALYPWGSDLTAGGKAGQLPETSTYEVGSLAFNRSSAGVYDLVGMLWQWVDQPYGPAPNGFKVLRGARHGLLVDLAYRQTAKPDDERFTRVAGVRCAAGRTAGE